MASLDFSGLKVLVVEDDSTLRKRIAARLEALGADVVAVDALAAAKASLLVRTFDFAFLDVTCRMAWEQTC